MLTRARPCARAALLAALLVALLAAPLAACASAQTERAPPRPHKHQYEEIVQKGRVSARLEHQPPAYIPAGQCTAHLAALRHQIQCEPSALAVRVRDFAPPASVSVADDLRSVDIRRTPNPWSGRCDGEALVDLKLECGMLADADPAGVRVQAVRLKQVGPRSSASAPAAGSEDDEDEDDGEEYERRRRSLSERSAAPRRRALPRCERASRSAAPAH